MGDRRPDSYSELGLLYLDDMLLYREEMALSLYREEGVLSLYRGEVVLSLYREEVALSYPVELYPAPEPELV